MRILILHEPYHGATPGGEGHVVRREHAVLAAHGVATRLLEWPAPLAHASALRKGLVQLQAGYSVASRRRARAEVAAFAPDIVHVHNFWPQLTPSVHYECRRAGIPVVQTLHNYRIMCVADFLLRDGQPCELCVGTLPWRGVLHRCDRKSAGRSTLKAAAFALHQMLDTWNRAINVFIAPSAAMREKFVRAGIDADRIVVHPQCAPAVQPGPESRRYFLYVGRLSPEKGVGTLLDIWQRMGTTELRIAGGGPLEARVRDAAARLANVHYLGPLSAAAALETLRGAIATLVPSLWEEPFPLVIAESYAAATPVIASDTGSRAETVAHGETGLVFAVGDTAALEHWVRWAAAHPTECRQMGRAARTRYEAVHSPEAGYARLMSTYQSVLPACARTITEGDAPDDARTAMRSVR